MASLYQVKASAGSGKTYDLTRRFLCLLAACGAPAPAAAASCGLGTGPSGWDEILAITFTNAAAGEMRDRVIGRLKAIALGTPEKGIPLTPDMAARWLDVILRDLASLNIRTIDSLLHAIVRSAALQLDLPPDFQPAFVSMDAVTPYLDTLLNQASQGNEKMEKLLRDLYWAIVHVQQSKGFNAGEKLGNIIRPLLDGILRDEFTDIASPEELESRHQQLWNRTRGLIRAVLDAEEQAKTKLHATSRKALVRLQERDEGAFKLKSIAEPEVDKFLTAKTKRTEELLSALEALTSWLPDFSRRHALLRSARNFAPAVQLATLLVHAMRANQQQEGTLPAVLVPEMAALVLSGSFGVSEALCRLGSRLQYFLLDEFQDTSREQWQALSPLVEEALSRGGSLTWVGDVKQAIYGWRGGDAALFDGIEAPLRLLAPDVRHETLTANWRSCRQVIAHNNALFSPLEDAAVARQALAALMPQDTPDDLLDSYAERVAAGYAGTAQDFSPSSPPGGLVRVEAIDGDSSEELNTAVLARLRHVLRQELAPRRRWQEIMVLVRSNAQAALVAEDLAAADIPIVTENSLLLSTHPLVIQSVALLQFLCNAEDELALWTVVTGSLVQQGPLPVPDLQALHDSCVDRGSIPLVQHLQRNFPGFWASVLAPFHNQAGLMTPYDTVMEWYDRLQVFERYPDADVFLRCFLEVLKNAEDQGLATLPDFLAHWQEKGEEEKVPMPEGIDAVRIMTVHKSKGLEAPVVLLPWTDATLKASDPVLMEEDGLRMVCKNGPHCGRVYYEALLRQAMELLNQFYVAFTRAREELLVFRTSAATVRKGCGSHAL
ncbi:MAG: UvrD-helicase domain-containing protein, partial [Desulfovibrio sp.]